MTDQEVLDDLKKEMEKTVAAFRRELARTRTGRASTALLEGIQAEYYGAKTPLIQLATLSAPEPRLLIVQPFDKAALRSEPDAPRRRCSRESRRSTTARRPL